MHQIEIEQIDWAARRCLAAIDEMETLVLALAESTPHIAAPPLDDARKLRQCALATLAELHRPAGPRPERLAQLSPVQRPELESLLDRLLVFIGQHRQSQRATLN